MWKRACKTDRCKGGDVWLLGKHRVICGDSILPETYDALMDGRKANLVLTDPPYNVNVEETAGKIKNDTCQMRISIIPVRSIRQHGAVDGTGCFQFMFSMRIRKG